MTVAAHLNIRLDEYDSRIRTFIPGYDAMLDAAARALQALDLTRPVVVDAGTGTGALAHRSLSAVPGAQIIAVDEDADILDFARQRLAAADGASFVQRSFLDFTWPPCDAVVASISLHHVRSTERKLELYREIRRAIRANGLLISADCFPSSDDRLREIEFEGWRAHLRSSYSDTETDAFFAAWAEEDLYVPLLEELALMEAAGFQPDVIWRSGPMAVIAARASGPISADGVGSQESPHGM